MSNDSRLIELSCKEVLMSIVKESKSLDKKLSFFQKTLLYDKIKEMKYEKVIGLLFNEGIEVTAEQKREFESKTKKTAKYGIAAYTGRKLAKYAAGGGPLKAGPKTILKTRNVHPLKDVGGKAIKKAKFKGMIGAVAGLYLYRKLTDPCVRKNLGNKQAQNVCKMEAIKKVIGQIKSDMGKCSSTSNPSKCQEKLSKELIKWHTKYQQYLVLVTKSRKK